MNFRTVRVYWLSIATGFSQIIIVTAVIFIIMPVIIMFHACSCNIWMSVYLSVCVHISVSVHMNVPRIFLYVLSLLFFSCSRNVKIKQETSNGVYSEYARSEKCSSFGRKT